MSHDKFGLDFLGVQISRVQTELREVGPSKSGPKRKCNAVDAKVGRVNAKVDRLGTRLDNFMASVDVRFDQIRQTMTTNLETLLNAINVRQS